MSDCLACWEGHEGKSAWSVAVSDHGVVATGGGDGGIHLWRLDSIVAGSTGIKEFDWLDGEESMLNLFTNERQLM